MSDLIRVVDLEVFAHIGVPDAERRDKQRLLISLELTVDSFVHAAGTDNVAWTVNYADVVQHVKDVTAKRQRKLLETLAEELAADLLKAFSIRKVGLEIKKFILPETQYVSVKLSAGMGLPDWLPEQIGSATASASAFPSATWERGKTRAFTGDRLSFSFAARPGQQVVRATRKSQ